MILEINFFVKLHFWKVAFIQNFHMFISKGALQSKRNDHWVSYAIKNHPKRQLRSVQPNKPSLLGEHLHQRVVRVHRHLLSAHATTKTSTTILTVRIILRLLLERRLPIREICVDV
jgi:hypothetical protein